MLKGLTLGIGLLALAAAAFPGQMSAQAQEKLPSPRREFRAIWVATVDNIDWPSKPGLPVAQQKSELLAILDRAVQMKMNAIVFQVRPQCDALYESKLEPWSEFLTGKMGQKPEPYYDPLAFVIEESHKRGLELHAWFNPYRAHHPASKSPISANHVSRKQPELVKQYGRFKWLDPGDPKVQEYSLAVVREVVRRYDVDGIHFDDYFYPYKERDSKGNILPFPDDLSWKRYRQSGGKLSRDDWRRDSVNQFVRRVYEMTKQEKKWVKFGISPFGIWRPGNPPQIKGFDQYQELYADARKWLVEGWVDYYTPQLYWKISQTAQSYPVLLKWWVEQNKHQRHMWPGNYAGRVGDGSANQWPVSEVEDQIRATRMQPGATGNVHFSAKVFARNRQGLSDKLARGVYAEPALVPASPWLDNQPPAKPKLRVSSETGSRQLRWENTGKEKAWLWVLRVKNGARWDVQVLPAHRTQHMLSAGATITQAAVSAVDRCGNESPIVTVAVN